jgi:hypothetical protein
MTAQKSAVFIYFTVEASNHTQQKIKSSEVGWFFYFTGPPALVRRGKNTKLI